MWMKRIAALSLIVAAVFAAEGCANSATDQTKTYKEDGYMGMSNSNPNLPINPTYHGYQQDSNMMKDALSKISGIRDSRINLNGSHATIKLFLPKDATDADMARIKQEAEIELTKAAPRYQYYVKMAR
ncbi:MAG: hypothetical protein K0Q81_1482 [Paenibacillus sp.]|jgi:hypothetical protein|nr:hypothetical protein [Paenibacillus sp.]